MIWPHFIKEYLVYIVAGTTLHQGQKHVELQCYV